MVDPDTGFPINNVGNDRVLSGMTVASGMTGAVGNDGGVKNDSGVKERFTSMLPLRRQYPSIPS